MPGGALRARGLVGEQIEGASLQIGTGAEHLGAAFLCDADAMSDFSDARFGGLAASRFGFVRAA